MKLMSGFKSVPKYKQYDFSTNPKNILPLERFTFNIHYQQKMTNSIVINGKECYFVKK